MNLFDTISEDIKKAMLAKDKVQLDALRGVKKEFLEAKTAKGGNGELTDEQAIKILQKMVKQRKDAAEMYINAGRSELAEKEMAETRVIESYLPAQMSDEELTANIQTIIQQLDAKGPQDMGKVMGAANKALSGKAEGRIIAQKVKDLLNQMS
jgi:uncharacterized protein YqeY